MISKWTKFLMMERKACESLMEMEQFGTELESLPAG